MSLADMKWNRTGSWSFFAPVHREKISPCALDCPVGEPIHQYMHHAANGNYRTAWDMIMAVNPLPAVCGRVCYHPCEGRCNRGELDQKINIHGMERFLGDMAIENGWGVNKPQEIKDCPPVAIVGSGPAGLAAAYHLRLLGYPVTVFERESAPGGMLRVGVPGYRMPRKIIDAEVARIEEMGVEFHCGTSVDNIEKLKEKHSAVFLATGAHGSRDPGVQNWDRPGVYFGLDFLKAYNYSESYETGKRVAVVGGGNTAIDVARASRRLGAQVDLYYRRTANEMPAHGEEVEQAGQEGVRFHFLHAPTEILTNGDGSTRGLVMQKMKLGEPDESGRARPVPVEGSEFEAEASCVVFAIGEIPETDYLNGSAEMNGNRVATDSAGRTSIEGVFAGGDICPGEFTVTHALADGRSAARYIDLWIQGQNPAEHTESEEQAMVAFENINTDYFDHGLRMENLALTSESPVDDDKELDRTLTEEQALTESARCFNCGTCINCDNCAVYCPDMSVRCDSDGVYKVDKEYCKGCGICASECPRYIITMEPKK